MNPLLALLALLGPQEAAPVPADELIAELKRAPATNAERVEALKALYEQAGAPAEAITLQPVASRIPDGPDSANVIVTKPGATDRVIVVGGHLDKVGVGGGVIDDWSGASLASNLYQAIREVPTEHTFVFMGFAYEEQGLVGSRHYVDQLGDEGRDRLAAMVNLECLGVGGPFIWANGSTDALEAIAHEVADANDLTLIDHVIVGVGADSMPFDAVGVPTITFDGLPLDQIRLIHSEADRFENVDPEVFTAVYDVVLPFLLALDEALPLEPAEAEADAPAPVAAEKP